MLGYYAAINYPYSVDNKSKNIAMVCDVMTHPDSRGQGVFTKIGHYSTNQLASEAFSFTTGYPVRPEVIPGHLKVGWKAQFKLPVYICPLKSHSILSSLRLSGLAFLVDPFLTLAHWIIKKTSAIAPSHCSVKVITQDELVNLDAYDEFFKSWSSDKKNYLVKDRKFLTWRLGAPKFEYKIAYIEKHGRIQALAITRTVELNRVPSLAILDLMVLPEANGSATLLIGELKTLAKHSNQEAVAMMLSKNLYRELGLMRSGFIPTPSTFTVITKLLDESSTTDFSNEEDWPLMWIDSDDL